MNTKEDSIAFSEVLDILQHSEIDVIEKIPLDIIKNIKEKSSKDYISKLDNQYDFDISKEAKAILAVIYEDYLCDEEEKEEFNNMLLENEKREQEELRKKYDPNNIFKNNKQECNNVYKNTQILKYKESLIKKILNRIKILFRRK